MIEQADADVVVYRAGGYSRLDVFDDCKDGQASPRRREDDAVPAIEGMGILAVGRGACCASGDVQEVCQWIQGSRQVGSDR